MTDDKDEKFRGHGAAPGGMMVVNGGGETASACNTQEQEMTEDPYHMSGITKPS